MTPVRYPAGLPPISADPPVHTWARRLLLPWFSHRRVAEYETLTAGSLPAAHVRPGSRPRVGETPPLTTPSRFQSTSSRNVLGVPTEMSDTFTGWVRDVLEFRKRCRTTSIGTDALAGYFTALIAERRSNPGGDLISALLQADIDGQPVPDDHILGAAALTFIAGVDTTWSAIGSSLWHLATHDVDRHRLAVEPDLLPRPPSKNCSAPIHQ